MSKTLSVTIKAMATFDLTKADEYTKMAQAVKLAQDALEPFGSVKIEYETKESPSIDPY